MKDLVSPILCLNVLYKNNNFYRITQGGSPTGNMLEMEYEAIHMEVALYGNILNYSWKDTGGITTKVTWFENLWHLTDYYGVKVHMKEDMNIGPAREGDVALMLAF